MKTRQEEIEDGLWKAMSSGFPRGGKRKPLLRFFKCDEENVLGNRERGEDKTRRKEYSGVGPVVVLLGLGGCGLRHEEEA